MAGQVEDRLVALFRSGRCIDRFPVGPNQSILAAADASTIDMEYGCGDGSCVRCIARLLNGDITYEQDPSALSQEQRQAGFVLLCIASPETDCRFGIGRAVLEDAFPELWGPDSGFR